jgi:nucleoside phosphorylase
MKILVVDDQHSKICKVINLLEGECKLPRDNLVVVQTATDARRALRATKFDLLILDVLLPLRAEDAPTIETSIELLQEIVEEDLYIRPSHIVGLTAYPEVAVEAGAHFREWLWTLIQFDQSTNDWAKPIRNCVDYIRRSSQQKQAEYETDVCVITALADPEMSAIHQLSWEWDAASPFDDATFIRRGVLDSGGRRCSLIAAVASRMGMVSTALLASKLILNFKPRFVVMTGVCAGIKEKTELGDIIFADPTWDWQSGKRASDRDNSQFAIAPHQLAAAEFIRARVQQLAGNSNIWHQIRTKWPMHPKHELRLLIGPIASGSAVLADGQVVTEIRSQQRTLLGIDMECYGLFAAASQASFPRPTPIVFKSVCDFADPDKNDDMQAYAAYTSANALQAFLETYLKELLPLAGA